MNKQIATISVSHSVIVNAMSAIPLLSVEMKSVKVVKKNASRPQDVECKPKQRVFQFSSALNVINT